MLKNKCVHSSLLHSVAMVIVQVLLGVGIAKAQAMQTDAAAPLSITSRLDHVEVVSSGCF